jgi:hypothetical protein
MGLQANQSNERHTRELIGDPACFDPPRYSRKCEYLLHTSNCNCIKPRPRPRVLDTEAAICAQNPPYQKVRIFPHGIVLFTLQLFKCEESFVRAVIGDIWDGCDTEGNPVGCWRLRHLITRSTLFPCTSLHTKGRGSAGAQLALRSPIVNLIPISFSYAGIPPLRDPER